MSHEVGRPHVEYELGVDGPSTAVGEGFGFDKEGVGG